MNSMLAQFDHDSALNSVEKNLPAMRWRFQTNQEAEENHQEAEENHQEAEEDHAEEEARP